MATTAVHVSGWRLLGKSTSDINGCHFTWNARVWATQLVVFFSLHWQKWIWLSKDFLTRWSGLIWAVIQWSELSRKHMWPQVTKEKWTRIGDEGVTNFLLPLPSHTDSFWPCLSQPLEFKLMMKWFVRTETTKLKCMLRLKETFILLSEMKTLCG